LISAARQFNHAAKQRRPRKAAIKRGSMVKLVMFAGAAAALAASAAGAVWAQQAGAAGSARLNGDWARIDPADPAARNTAYLHLPSNLSIVAEGDKACCLRTLSITRGEAAATGQIRARAVPASDVDTKPPASLLNLDPYFYGPTPDVDGPRQPRGADYILVLESPQGVITERRHAPWVSRDIKLASGKRYVTAWRADQRVTVRAELGAEDAPVSLWAAHYKTPQRSLATRPVAGAPRETIVDIPCTWVATAPPNLTGAPAPAGEYAECRSSEGVALATRQTVPGAEPIVWRAKSFAHTAQSIPLLQPPASVLNLAAWGVK